MPLLKGRMRIPKTWVPLMAQRIVDSIISKDLVKITVASEKLLSETEEPQKRVSLESLDNIPERQRRILEVLSRGEMTPPEIISNLESIDEYKNRDNALRSVNNLLGRLRKEGLVERKRVGKTYKYQIAGKYQTMLVET